MRYANNGVYLYDQGLWFVALYKPVLQGETMGWKTSDLNVERSYGLPPAGHRKHSAVVRLRRVGLLTYVPA